jgi:folylpolyglutamate synthase
LTPVQDSHVPEEHFKTIPEKPVYFRFLTLLAFHVFLSLKLRLTVLEVGMGGTYDSTNVVPRPLITGITALGLDHTFMLGDTVEEIAGNKGGIFKQGVPAMAVQQEGNAKRGEGVLRDRAEELEVSRVGIYGGGFSSAGR